MQEIPFKDLPLYSYDYDADFPPVARAFKEAIASVDAVLFVTPEYNRSIPGGLKNAIDWASRPYGKNSFARKPSAVIGTSPGAIGTAVAQQSLRSVLSFCNSPQMNAPEAYIQFTPGLITDAGEVTVESTRSSCAITGPNSVCSWHGCFKSPQRRLSVFAQVNFLIFEYAWAGNQIDRLSALAAELVRRQVAVVVTFGGKADNASAAQCLLLTQSGHWVASPPRNSEGAIARLSSVLLEQWATTFR